jgi:hypothetical protein
MSMPLVICTKALLPIESGVGESHDASNATTVEATDAAAASARHRSRQAARASEHGFMPGPPADPSRIEIWRAGEEQRSRFRGKGRDMIS